MDRREDDGDSLGMGFEYDPGEHDADSGAMGSFPLSPKWRTTGADVTQNE
jgi:hypothetical protein